MGALGGGGGGAVPPDMLAALGGGGPAEAPAGALHAGSAAAGDPEDSYRAALDELTTGVQADNDEQRIQTILTCISKIQGTLAASEKALDGMLAGKMDQSAVRRMGAADAAY